jgi:hypothetical protein
MRLSALIAKCEDTVITQTPKAKALALRTTHQARNHTAAALAKLALRIATRDMLPPSHPNAEVQG